MDDFDLLAADLKKPSKRYAAPPSDRIKPRPVDQPSVEISSNVEGARTDEELRQLLRKHKEDTVVVNFGSSWCHSCHALFPHFYRFTSQFGALKYIIAQVDYMHEEASDLEYTPTFKIVRQGKDVDQFYGANQQVLKDRLWLHSD